MTRPEVKVEIAFNAGYATPAASRTWTDVTSYVLQVSGVGVEHGRRDEYSVAEFNSLSLVLNNADGRFTPGLASSPYYPNVKLGRPIRVTSTPSGQAASVRFVGYVDSWPVEWPGVVEAFAECRITARSRMARLGRGVELRSLVEEEILADGPDAYYPLAEMEGAVTASDASGNGEPTLGQAGTGDAVVFGTAMGQLGVQGATFAEGGQVLRTTVGRPMTPSLTAFTVECCALVSSGQSVQAIAVLPPGEIEAGTSGGRPGYGYFTLKIGATGLAQVEFTDTSEVNDLIADADSVAGAPAHLAAAFANGGTMELFVNGASQGTATVGNWPTVVEDFVIGFNTGTGSPSATLAHVAVHSSVLSSARIAAHAEAFLTGFAGETCAERLTRYAGYAGIPTAETDFETGQVADLAHIDTTGKTALAVMREVEATEGGALFDARDGTLTFHDRAHRYATTAAVTLDVDAGEVAPAYAPVLDDVALRNDVTATGAGGVTARVVDADSVADHGAYRESLDLATTNPDEPFGAASWRVGNYAEPAVRVPTLTVELATLSPARQAAVLALGVGDKISVTNLLAQSDTSTKSFFIEGYAEAVGSATHTLTFNVSPAAVDDVWILGDSTYGVLGSTTRLGY